MYRFAEQITQALARGLAQAGGLILVVLVALTVVSIGGRALVPLDIGLGPIRGIYDMTELGIAAAVFAFLPYAQFKEAHARVDLFQRAMPGAVNRLLDMLFHVVMTFAAGVGTWRLALGMVDKRSFGETTLIAEIPVWQGYALGLVGASGFVVVSAFCVWRAARRVIWPLEATP